VAGILRKERRAAMYSRPEHTVFSSPAGQHRIRFWLVMMVFFSWNDGFRNRWNFHFKVLYRI